jgi:uncharacterized membrane protein YdbT with pleckstrin-like domain
VSYVDKNLISGESVTYRARLHWVLFVKPSVIAVLIIAIAGFVFYATDLINVLSIPATLACWIGVLLISSFPVLAAALKWHSAEFAVTNKRVILKIGLVQSKIAEMFLNKIESVGVEQSIIGRILRYGSIVIRGTGGSLEPFHRISAPLEFRKQIQEQIGKSFETLTRPASAR